MKPRKPTNQNLLNQVFLIPKPEPGDTRERNAFGIVKGIEKAAKQYYADRDSKRKE